MWDTSEFALDANVLLNLYRRSRPTREDLIGVLRTVDKRLWIPHQAALEYHRNRLLVIAEQTKRSDDLVQSLVRAERALTAELQTCRKHAFIEAASLESSVQRFSRRLARQIASWAAGYPDLLSEDTTGDLIASLLDGKVGPSYPQETLTELYAEGERRCKEHIPPGFRDCNKEGNERYGDWIVWRQLLDRGQEARVPVIFVTDDSKDDWYVNANGATHGPRPELVEEMLAVAGVSFYAYPMQRFIDHAKRYLNATVSDHTIREIQEAVAEGPSATVWPYIGGLAAMFKAEQDLLGGVAARMKAEQHALEEALNPPWVREFRALAGLIGKSLVHEGSGDEGQRGANEETSAPTESRGRDNDAEQ